MSFTIQNVDVADDVTIGGNLVVTGSTSITSIGANFEDNHLFLNNAYTTNAPQTGGLIVNSFPTTTVDTVAGSFTSSTVTTTGSATFSAGDIIMISGANNTKNNNLFEVLTHVTNTLTIDTTPTEDFTANTFTADTTTPVAGSITKTTISVIRSGLIQPGFWEVGFGAVVPMAYSTITAAQTDIVTTTDATVTTLATILTIVDTTSFITVHIVGRNTTDDTSSAFRLERTYRNSSDTLSQVGGDSTLEFNEDALDMSVAISTSGSDILVRVTGAAAKTIDWKSTVTPVRV